ncbi:MAG: indole-3-glycerol phosphate synthase TrpC [Candidatus Roizmanbacteria bacterium]
MKNILDEIVLHKKEEIAQLKKIYNTKQYIKKANCTFIDIFQNNREAIAIIAEIKRSSPSAGLIKRDLDIQKWVKEYVRGGCNAISIVTDASYFQGSIDMIDEVKKSVTVPVLQKDFIIDEIQIIEASHHNVDALLLIARIVDKDILNNFVNICLSNGIEPIVEAYDEKDLEKALLTSAKCIAINARDLQTFQINIERACKLGAFIPKDRYFLAFSGATNLEDISVYKHAGARAVLVGTALMKSNDPAKLIREFKS